VELGKRLANHELGRPPSMPEEVTEVPASASAHRVRVG